MVVRLLVFRIIFSSPMGKTLYVLLPVLFPPGFLLFPLMTSLLGKGRTLSLSSQEDNDKVLVPLSLSVPPSPKFVTETEEKEREGVDKKEETFGFLSPFGRMPKIGL